MSNKELLNEYKELIGAYSCNDSWEDEFSDQHVDSDFMTYEDSYSDESDGEGHADNSY